MRHFLLALMLAVPALAQQPSPQQPSPSVVAQREALTKLAFLIGKWSGPVTVARGPGEPLHLTQTEDVQLKLDGLLILIEGNSRAEDGQNAFRALATITYDDAAHLYHFRAYHDGRYVDTELAVPTNGFTWSFDAGPAHIVNTMHLTSAGEWAETTEAVVGSNPPRKSVDMLLKRQP
jgi:hypothetical protein